MRKIDFLPNAYREQDANRKTNLYRLGLVALFGGIIAAASLTQFAVRRHAAIQLAEVEPAYRQAKALSAELDARNKQREAIEHHAQLYAYLMHPWPTTHLLSVIVQPLPESVALTKLHLTHERTAIQNNATRFARRPRSAAKPADELEKLPPARRDLKRLEDDDASLQLVIHLSGQTVRIDHLHQYLAKLGESSVLSKAELLSIESIESGAAQGKSQFHIRLTVLNGYEAMPRRANDVARLAAGSSATAAPFQSAGQTP